MKNTGITKLAILGALILQVAACGPMTSDPFKNSSVDRDNLDTQQNQGPKETVKVVEKEVERPKFETVEKPVPQEVRVLQDKNVYVRGDEIRVEVPKYIQKNEDAVIAGNNIVSFSAPRNMNFILGQESHYTITVSVIDSADLDFELVLIHKVNGMTLTPVSHTKNKAEYLFSWTPAFDAIPAGSNEVLSTIKIGLDDQKLVVKNKDPKEAEKLKTILKNTDYTEDLGYMVRRDLKKPTIAISDLSGHFEEGNRYPFTIDLQSVNATSDVVPEEPLRYYHKKNMASGRFEQDANFLIDASNPNPQFIPNPKSVGGIWRFSYAIDTTRKMIQDQDASGNVIPDATSVVVRFAVRGLDPLSGVTSDEATKTLEIFYKSAPPAPAAEAAPAPAPAPLAVVAPAPTKATAKAAAKPKKAAAPAPKKSKKKPTKGVKK